MSRLDTALKNDLKLLTLMRDEIGLQAHLLKADPKDRWNDLEQKWSKLKAQVDRAEVAAGDAGREVNAAAAQLVDSLKTGYSSIKQALRQ